MSCSTRKVHLPVSESAPIVTRILPVTCIKMRHTRMPDCRRVVLTGGR